MGTESSKQKRRDCFPRDEVILGTKGDRRVSVEDTLIFPFNLIGLVQSREFIKQNEAFQDLKGTGFLISQNLVVSSSHNFVVRDQKNGKVKKFIPYAFFLPQQTEYGPILKSIKVKRFKINLQFVQILNKIVALKKLYISLENDQKLIMRLEKDILALEAEAIQHDFALLELQQKFIRPQYFQMFPNLSQKIQLVVTGYSGSHNLWSHSNNFSYINNKGIYYDIDTKAGQSGGPVYLFGDKKKVAGIHKGYDPLKQRNFATLITKQVIEVLNLWIKEMKIFFKEVKEETVVPVPFNEPTKKQEIRRTEINQANDIWEKGNQLKQQGYLEKAVTCYDQALCKFQIMQVNEQIDWAIAFYDIGDKFYRQHNKQQALKCYKRALIIFVKIGTKSIYWANTLNNIGLIQKKQKKERIAIKYFEEALAIYQTIGNGSVECANILNNIGDMYEINQPQLALIYYNQALNIHQKIGHNTIQRVNTLFSIANAYAYKGLHDKSVQVQKLAQTMKKNCRRVTI